MRRQVFVTGFRGVALHATSNFFSTLKFIGRVQRASTPRQCNSDYEVLNKKTAGGRRS